MSNPKSLVVVVGAGASSEVHLPVGAVLKERIANVLNHQTNGRAVSKPGDAHIFQAFNWLSGAWGANPERMNELLAAGWRIRDAMSQAPSIDNFIHAHRSNADIALCGKLAIARCILVAERDSTLRIPPGNIYNKLDFAKNKSTWYTAFFQTFLAPFDVDDLLTRLARITFITFNYDRCIEHYFFNAFKNYYALGDDEAKRLVSSLQIYHPYGSLGDLPWTGSVDAIEFGGEPNSESLIKVARNLKTFTEGTDKMHSDIAAIRETMHTANKIAFLGFAFNQQNMDLLFGEPEMGQPLRAVSMYGTAWGISESNTESIRRELFRLSRSNTNTTFLERQHKCSDLIYDYSRNLAF